MIIIVGVHHTGMMYAALLLIMTTIHHDRPISQPPLRASWKTVELAGRFYRFPTTTPAYVKKFDDAAEVALPIPVWRGILEQVAPVTGWQARDSGIPILIYLTRPNDIFQWKERAGNEGPPVREPVRLEQARKGMRFWASRGAYGAQDLVYVTYDGRPDI